MDYAETLRSLPETMPTDAISELLQKMYAAGVAGEPEGKLEQAQFLWELANRQWHNYALLPTSTQSELEDFIIAMLLPPVSEEFAEALLGVILHLGLQGAFDALRDNLTHQTGTSLSERFLHELHELPDDISDPYREFWEPGKGLAESDRSLAAASLLAHQRPDGTQDGFESHAAPPAS